MTNAVPAGHSPTPIRSWKERVLQTLAYETGGLFVISPLWATVSGSTSLESVTLLAAMSVAVMTWMALYNTVFDLVEASVAGRVASDRPQRWRLVHAVGLEVSSVVATTPVIVLITGYGWTEAVLVDIGLGLAYAAYGYVFHLVFDRLRPVKEPKRAPGKATA